MGSTLQNSLIHSANYTGGSIGRKKGGVGRGVSYGINSSNRFCSQTQMPTVLHELGIELKWAKPFPKMLLFFLNEPLVSQEERHLIPFSCWLWGSKQAYS